MDKIFELPLALRILIFLGIPALIIIGLLVFAPKDTKEPDFTTGPTGVPSSTETPNETPEPSTPPEPPSPEEEQAISEEEKAEQLFTAQKDEKDLEKVIQEGKTKGAEDVAIEAVENYYAYSTNESRADREKRLSKFFLPDSPYLTSVPTGTLPDDIEYSKPEDPSERFDMGGSVGTGRLHSYTDGVVVYNAFIDMKVRANNLAAEGKDWIFRYDVIAQVAMKKFDGKWKVIAISEEGARAR